MTQKTRHSFYWAMIDDDLLRVREIISKPNFQPNDFSDDEYRDRNCLALAAHYGKIKICEILLKKFPAILNQSPNKKIYISLESEESLPLDETLIDPMSSLLLTKDISNKKTIFNLFIKQPQFDLKKIHFQRALQEDELYYFKVLFDHYTQHIHPQENWSEILLTQATENYNFPGLKHLIQCGIDPYPLQKSLYELAKNKYEENFFNSQSKKGHAYFLDYEAILHSQKEIFHFWKTLNDKATLNENVPFADLKINKFSLKPKI